MWSTSIKAQIGGMGENALRATTQNTWIHLYLKEGCLFVLFVCHIEITLANEWGVHQVGFMTFQPIVEKLSNIEHKFC
jgi:hypothetical protein